MELFLSATERAVAMCWLKNQVPARIEDKCCVSGVRGAGVVEPRTGPRSNFRSTAPAATTGISKPRPEPDGEACKAACDGDNKCRAWTYVRPGYISVPPARCFLKDELKRPRHKPCCISGVVQVAIGVNAPR